MSVGEGGRKGANGGKSGGISIQFSLDAITREIGTASPHLFNG